jgi:AcrR family transcriptional regulator
MARPVSIKDETILAAAREVFLERGIQATTAEVAERAGVSEGTVFKRFRSKVDLFRAAMNDHLGEALWLRLLAERVGKGDLRENLFEAGMSIIAFFRNLLPFMMMAWSNPGPDGLPAFLSAPNPPPLQALKKLSGFFEAEMRAGRIRRHDPEVVARSFIGPLQNYVFFEIVHRAQAELPLAQETFVRGLVNLLWSGLEPGASSKGR